MISSGPIVAAAWLLFLAGSSCGATSSENCDDPANAAFCTGETDEGPSCEDEFGDPPGTQSLELELRNDRSVPIFVPNAVTTCAVEPFRMYRGEDQIHWYPSAYVPTCESLIQSQCSWGCSDGPAQVLRLAPGASHVYAWTGHAWVPSALSASCASEGGCAEGTSCFRGEQLSSGMLELGIAVHTECIWGDDPTCDCGGDDCFIDVDTLSVEGAGGELRFPLSFDAAGPDRIVVSIP